MIIVITAAAAEPAARAAVFTHATSISQALACRCHGCLYGTAVHARRTS